MNSVEAVRLWDKGVLLSTKWIGSEGDVKKMTTSQEKERLGRENREKLDGRFREGTEKVTFIDDALKQLLEEGGFSTFIWEQCFDNVNGSVVGGIVYGGVESDEEKEFMNKTIWEAIVSGWNEAVHDQIGTGYVMEPFDWRANIRGAMDLAYGNDERKHGDILANVLGAYEFLFQVFRGEKKVGIWVDVVLLVSILMKDLLGTLLGPVELCFKRDGKKKEQKNERVVQLTAITQGGRYDNDEVIREPFDEPSVIITLEEKSNGTKNTLLSISTAYKTSMQADKTWKDNVQLGGKFEAAWKDEIMSLDTSDALPIDAEDLKKMQVKKDRIISKKKGEKKPGVASAPASVRGSQLSEDSLASRSSGADPLERSSQDSEESELPARRSGGTGQSTSSVTNSWRSLPLPSPRPAMSSPGSKSGPQRSDDSSFARFSFDEFVKWFNDQFQTWDNLDDESRTSTKERVQELYDRLAGGIEQAATESPGDATLLYQHCLMIEVQLFLHNPAILRAIRNIWSNVKKKYSHDSAGETCALLQQCCELIGVMMDAIGSAGREGVLTMRGESGKSLAKLFEIWIQIAWILYKRAMAEGCLQIDADGFAEMFTLLKSAEVFVAKRGLEHFKKEGAKFGARYRINSQSSSGSGSNVSDRGEEEGRGEKGKGIRVSEASSKASSKASNAGGEDGEGEKGKSKASKASNAGEEEGGGERGDEGGEEAGRGEKGEEIRVSKPSSKASKASNAGGEDGGGEKGKGIRVRKASSKASKASNAGEEEGGGEWGDKEEEAEGVAKEDRKKEQDGDPVARRRAVSASMPSLPVPAARRASKGKGGQDRQEEEEEEEKKEKDGDRVSRERSMSASTPSLSAAGRASKGEGGEGGAGGEEGEDGKHDEKKEGLGKAKQRGPVLQGKLPALGRGDVPAQEEASDGPAKEEEASDVVSDDDVNSVDVEEAEEVDVHRFRLSADALDDDVRIGSDEEGEVGEASEAEEGMASEAEEGSREPASYSSGDETRRSSDADESLLAEGHAESPKVAASTLRDRKKPPARRLVPDAARGINGLIFGINKKDRFGRGKEEGRARLVAKEGAPPGDGPAAAGPALPVPLAADAGLLQFAGKPHGWNNRNDAVRSAFLPRFLEILQMAYKEVRQREDVASKADDEVWRLVKQNFSEGNGVLQKAWKDYKNMSEPGGYLYYNVLQECRLFVEGVLVRSIDGTPLTHSLLRNLSERMHALEGWISSLGSDVPGDSVLKNTRKAELQLLLNYIHWFGCVFFDLFVRPQKNRGGRALFEKYKESFGVKKEVEKLLPHGPALAVDVLVDNGLLQFSGKEQRWNATNHAIRNAFLPLFEQRLKSAYENSKGQKEVDEVLDLVPRMFSEFAGNIESIVNVYEETDNGRTGNFFYFKVLMQCKSFVQAVDQNLHKVTPDIIDFLNNVQSIVSKIDELIQLFDSSVAELEGSTLKASGRAELQKLRNYIHWFGCLFFDLGIVRTGGRGASKIGEKYKETFDNTKRKELEEELSEND